MQIDSESKIIFVHIPRTGGSWFTYAWPSNKRKGKIISDGKKLINLENNLSVECGRHGRWSGIKEKLDRVKYDYSDHKLITLVREPFDRVGSSWVWFSQVKGTAYKHGWKSIDDMLDEYESGGVRSNYIPQTYWLEEQGADWDSIYRFEDLIGDSSVVINDFPLFNDGQKKKNSLKRQGQVRSSAFTDSQRQRIRVLYKDDFRYLEKYYG